jgi:ribosome maturation factor RimP
MASTQNTALERRTRPLSRPVDIQALEQLAAPVVAGLGYELVDLEWKHEAGHWVLRILIDREPAPDATPEAGASPASPTSTVGLEDCARVSHTLGAEIDVADAIHVPFHLEVSSPGLNRPLRREADFRRFAGHKARVRTRTPVEDPGSPSGRRNFAGRLVGAEGGRVRIDVEGKVFEFPVTDVEKANLVYEFKS